MDKKILVIAAHPDDEALGCDGSIARWADEGSLVYMAFLADGVGARNPDSAVAREALARRRASAVAAADTLGARSVELPDNQLDTVPLLQVTQRIEALIDKSKPNTVVTHHAGDLNIDHRRVRQAVMTVCRPQQRDPVRKLLCF